MSFVGSDDLPLCDGPCNTMGLPDMIAPWPVTGPVDDASGRKTRDRRNTLHLCADCVREIVLAADLEPRAHDLAVASSARWEVSRALLDAAERTLRGAA